MLNCWTYALFRLACQQKESDLRSATVSPSMEGETIARIRYPAGVRAGNGASPRYCANHDSQESRILCLGRAPSCHRLPVARVVDAAGHLRRADLQASCSCPLCTRVVETGAVFRRGDRLQPRCAARHQRRSAYGVRRGSDSVSPGANGSVRSWMMTGTRNGIMPDLDCGPAVTHLERLMQCRSPPCNETATPRSVATRGRLGPEAGYRGITRGADRERRDTK